MRKTLETIRIEFWENAHGGPRAGFYDMYATLWRGDSAVVTWRLRRWNMHKRVRQVMEFIEAFWEVQDPEEGSGPVPPSDPR